MITFHEFLAERDPELYEGWKNVVGAGILGAASMLPSMGCKGPSCPAPTAPASKRIEDKKVTSPDARKFIPAQDNRREFLP